MVFYLFITLTLTQETQTSKISLSHTVFMSGYLLILNTGAKFHAEINTRQSFKDPNQGRVYIKGPGDWGFDIVPIFLNTSMELGYCDP